MINYVNFAFSSLGITAQPVGSLVLLKNIAFDLALETQVLGAKGSMRRTALTTKLEFRVC